VRRIWLLAAIALLCAGGASAQSYQRAYGFCEVGGQNVTVQGLTQSSPPAVQASYPSCTVTVYVTGTETLATIYEDSGGTVPLSNPFTAAANGYWDFYAVSGRYDAVESNGGLSTPFTFGDICLGCTVSGPAGQCPPSSGTLHGVISENPVGTCFDNGDFTWNDSLSDLEAGTGGTYGTVQDVTMLGSSQKAGTAHPVVQGAAVGNANVICSSLETSSCNTDYAFGYGNDAAGTDQFIFGATNAGGTGSGGPEAHYAWMVGQNHALVNGATTPANGVYLFGDNQSSCNSNETVYDTGVSVLKELYSFGSCNQFYHPDPFETSSSVSNVVLMGEYSSSVTNGGGSTNSVAQFLHGFGHSNVFTVNTNGLPGSSTGTLMDATLVGTGNSAQDSNGTTARYLGAFGYNDSLTNCSHCWAFGENGAVTSSNYIGIGLSASPELTITPNAVKTSSTSTFAAASYGTLTNCQLGGSSGTASPAACGAAAAGTIAIPTTTTTYTVDTTAVTANSQITLRPRTDNTNIPSGPTCVFPPTPFIAYVTGRTAGTSFTFTLPSTTGVSCWDYTITN
jgi:hypothetical protein